MENGETWQTFEEFEGSRISVDFHAEPGREAAASARRNVTRVCGGKNQNTDARRLSHEYLAEDSAHGPRSACTGEGRRRSGFLRAFPALLRAALSTPICDSLSSRRCYRTTGGGSVGRDGGRSTGGNPPGQEDAFGS